MLTLFPQTLRFCIKIYDCPYAYCLPSFHAFYVIKPMLTIICTVIIYIYTVTISNAIHISTVILGIVLTKNTYYYIISHYYTIIYFSYSQPPSTDVWKVRYTYVLIVLECFSKFTNSQ